MAPYAFEDDAKRRYPSSSAQSREISFDELEDDFFTLPVFARHLSSFSSSLSLSAFAFNAAFVGDDTTLPSSSESSFESSRF